MNPIDIIVITYQRLHFLKQTIDKIDERTLYPHRIIVVDNHSTDGTVEYLKEQKKIGKINEVLFLPENIGQPQALNEGFRMITSDLFITTQDDLIPPDLRPCWLERLVHLTSEYPDYGAICMRIQRTARLDVDESKDLIDTRKSMPSVFRIQRKSDLPQENPFGKLKHWESHVFIATMQNLKKKCAMATHLYAEHIGFMPFNKGYDKESKDYFTYSRQRVNQGEEKPYPDIDPKTNKPIKINHLYDRREQFKREEFELDVGRSSQAGIRRKQGQRDLLAKYCTGKGIDVGCGQRRVCLDAIGIDIIDYPDNPVDMPFVSGDDLWMFKDRELDYVVASHSLEHFPNTKKTLEEWDRVLKVGGIMGFIVPDGELRPRTILERSHQVALTKRVIHNLMKHGLGYKPLELRNMTELAGGNAQKSILAVYRKRK